MNYWIEICKYTLSRWYDRCKNRCYECHEYFEELSDYMIVNHIIL